MAPIAKFWSIIRVMATPAIKLTNLTKRYGASRGIEKISLEVQPGEIFGFLGPNGAGKTTTIRTIMNFIGPTEGKAEIFGLDSQQESVAIKRRIGYLAGDIALYQNLTGKQLLTYLGSMGGQVDWEYVHELAERFQADLGRRLRSLSKGNEQKIGLIQAFMHRPDLLLLDEPTSGLDPLMQEEFYRLAEEYKSEGKTLFISSHNLAEVQRLCDRAAFVREGRLVATEQIAQLESISVHKFIVTFRDPVKSSEFRKLGHADVTERSGQKLHFTVSGSTDQFIKALAHHTVLDISEQEATLEEIFLRHYREGD